jgi:hypothetical protein
MDDTHVIDETVNLKFIIFSCKLRENWEKSKLKINYISFISIFIQTFVG